MLSYYYFFVRIFRYVICRRGLGHDEAITGSETDLNLASYVYNRKSGQKDGRSSYNPNGTTLYLLRNLKKPFLIDI